LKLLVFLYCILPFTGFPQTLGGRTTYNFIKLPASPILTAAGGVNTAYRTNEVSLTANNPALLFRELSTQINASFNAFLGAIKTYSLTGAYHAENAATTFGGHIYFVDYGTIPASDAAGNSIGNFRPRDYVVQVSGAKKYLQKWTYGGTIKFISSSYQQYASTAIAVDFGVLFLDSAKQFSASFLAKNIGVQLKTYAGEKEDLPFDLQVGITKRLARAPFGFSLTAHHVHRFNISYSDPAFNSDNGVSSASSFTKIFNHFVLATHIYFGQNLEATVGYNQLRREELSIPNNGGGLSGFSAGLRIKFSKLQIMYARSAYQKGIGYNQIGITAQLNKLVGL